MSNNATANDADEDEDDGGSDDEYEESNHSSGQDKGDYDMDSEAITHIYDVTSKPVQQTHFKNKSMWVNTQEPHNTKDNCDSDYDPETCSVFYMFSVFLQTTH